jgi:DNA (cytosine-5)-methyltransferase 1
MVKRESKPLIKWKDAELDAFALLTHQSSHGSEMYPVDFTPGRESVAKQTQEIIGKKLDDGLGMIFRLKKAGGSARFTFIDLFAGIGGFRLAGENSGGKCIFTSEKDKYARISYYHNFGEMPFGDINILTNEQNIRKIPDHEVLCGGFPCQAFSISGKRLGFADERGVLFYKIRDILQDKIRKKVPTKVVFLENVRNFRNHGSPKGNTFKTIREELESLGYKVADVVLNSGQLGAATKRERIYIVAIHEMSFPKKSLESFFKEFTSLETLREGGTPVKDYIEELSSEEIGSYLIPAERIMTKFDVINSEDEYAQKARLHQPIQIGEIGKRGDPRKGRQGERIYSIHGQSITFSAYGGGLAARTGAYLIKDQVRKLTPKECAKIMGFVRKTSNGKATMDVRGLNRLGLSDWQLYKQFGNSVVVSTVERIYHMIDDHFFTEE